MIIEIPAGRYELFASSAADSVIGQEFDLDERIAGIGGMAAKALSADERGLWTKARVVAAEVVQDGKALRLTIEAA